MLNLSAFGKNDIRGIYGEDITEELFYYTGRGFVKYLAKHTNKDNKDSFWKKWAIFRSLKKEFPWKYITWRYAKIGDRRERICYFLYWSNVYFLIAYIKDKFHN